MVSLQQQADSAGKTQAGIERRRLIRVARASARFKAHNGVLLPTAIFMTDPTRSPDPVRIATRLPTGWGVIYRHFGAADRFETAKMLARICRRRRLTLLISADPDLARRIGADGVHWPEAELARRGQRRASRGLIETAAVHSRRALFTAARMGVDAAIVSAVFPSQSPSAGAPMGAVKFRLLARASCLPVYALGGINARTAGRIFSGAGSHVAGWAAVETIVSGWDR
jgi:thiamine-phosphate pyrophosphorylase